MAGIHFQPEKDCDVSHQPRAVAVSVADMVSDDDRSTAAESWSIKSDCGSTLDDEQNHAAAASDYSSDKDETDAEAVSSMLGFQSYWDSAYTDELTNFCEHGHTGEVWFGVNVMEVVASWTKALCIDISQGRIPNHVEDVKAVPSELDDNLLSCWSVLDIGTGNGLLLQELAKQGFSDLTGTDYSEQAISLAQSLANRDGFPNIKFLVDDVLETTLEQEFQLVMDKGTLDAIGLHPDGPVKRMLYWDSVSKLVAPGGILVITSCNNTKDELVQEVENFNQRKLAASLELVAAKNEESCSDHVFQYVNHVRTYPTFTFGGSVGSRVATVAFRQK
ncbi:unnamed protein product [Lupinus luteus]|uniref:Protein-lysine N-methyltransferase LLUT_LOCUS15688 n=1 Tax=Lupinus luteus TaxID=3873 RepID=A0AAV1WZB7_LUPLU